MRLAILSLGVRHKKRNEKDTDAEFKNLFTSCKIRVKSNQYQTGYFDVEVNLISSSVTRDLDDENDIGKIEAQIRLPFSRRKYLNSFYEIRFSNDIDNWICRATSMDILVQKKVNKFITQDVNTYLDNVAVTGHYSQISESSTRVIVNFPYDDDNIILYVEKIIRGNTAELFDQFIYIASPQLIFERDDLGNDDNDIVLKIGFGNFHKLALRELTCSKISYQIPKPIKIDPETIPLVFITKIIYDDDTNAIVEFSHNVTEEKKTVFRVELERKNLGGAESGGKVSSSDRNRSSFTVGGLEENREYEFVMVLYDDNLEISRSPAQVYIHSKSSVDLLERQSLLGALYSTSIFAEIVKGDRIKLNCVNDALLNQNVTLLIMSISDGNSSRIIQSATNLEKDKHEFDFRNLAKNTVYSFLLRIRVFDYFVNVVSFDFRTPNFSDSDPESDDKDRQIIFGELEKTYGMEEAIELNRLSLTTLREIYSQSVNIENSAENQGQKGDLNVRNKKGRQNQTVNSSYVANSIHNTHSAIIEKDENTIADIDEGYV